MRVYHVFPYPWYVSGGHANAARTFIECQLKAGIDARAISPAPDPALLRHPVPQVDISAGRGTVMQVLRDHLITASPKPIEPNAKTLQIPPQPCPITYVEYDNADWDAVVSQLIADDVAFHLHHLKQSIGISKVLRKRGIPYVYTSHGELQFQDATKFAKKFAYLNFASRIVRGASALHLLTERERDRLKVLLPFYQGSMHVVPQVVELPTQSVIPADRSKYGIPDGAFLFLFLGRLDMIQKGLDVLLDAFVKVPDAHLALVGPEFRDHLGTLKQQTQRLNLSARVHFLGPQYGDEKWRVLKMGDVFVSPSRWEGFAISLVEAMGIGVPSITTPGSNIGAELTRANAAAISALDADALAASMVDLMKDANKRSVLAQNAQKWVHEVCSPAGAGAKYRECYASVMRRTRDDAKPATNVSRMTA